MRFLVDNARSPALAVLLTDAGHDAVHVRALNLQHAQDIAIFEQAAGDDRVVVSADTDFGTLLATRSARKPSVIQFRGPGSRKPDALARTLLSNLAHCANRTRTSDCRSAFVSRDSRRRVYSMFRTEDQ